MRGIVRALATVMLFVLAPAAVYAQATLAGTARDTSGAVLPGVTVEAASPVLIEKVRTALTDATGRYTIPDLRPGDYTVTFTLPGFRTVVRQGVSVSGTAVITINADLSVGGVEETITVSGDTPVVDLQSTTGVGQEIGQEHIGGLGDGVQDFAAFLAGQIETDTAFAAVRMLHHRIDPAADLEHAELSQAALRVAMHRVLDFDHVRSEVGELHGTERATHDLGEVDDPDAIEGESHARNSRSPPEGGEGVRMGDRVSAIWCHAGDDIHLQPVMRITIPQRGTERSRGAHDQR